MIGAAALALATMAASASPQPVAHFAPGTVPGTLRYQVVSEGGAGGDISGSLGTLTNLDVLAGPILEQQVVWRGGEPAATTVLTWVLRARTPGPIGVGPTRVRFGDTALVTNAVTGSALASGPRGGGAELFTQLSRARLLVGEPLVVQFLVAAPDAVAGEGWEVQASFPDSWSERLQPPGASPEGERGWPPGLRPLGRWLVIPARVGRLEIPPAVARAADLGADADSAEPPLVRATSQPVAVEVDKLPAAPAPFFGAVGDLSFSRRLIAESAEGDLTTVEISVHGTGNLPLLAPPPLSLPAGVHSFAPEETHEWRASARGLVGWRRWRVPLEVAPGRYELPAVTFCTFRPWRNYTVQTLPALTLAVRPAATTTTAPAPPPPRWPAAAFLVAAFLAGAGSVLAVRAWRHHPSTRGDASADPGEELRRLQLAVEAWGRSRWGVEAGAGVDGWTVAGCRRADAEEAVTLIAACDRLRLAPGLADPAAVIPGLRLRVQRLLAAGGSAATLQE